MTSRLQQLEEENKDLKKVTDDLRSLVLSLESRVKNLESSKPASQAQVSTAPKPVASEVKATAADDDDDDVDLFGSDDEDEEAERIKQERVAAYAAKKSKSNFTFCSRKFLVFICVKYLIFLFKILHRTCIDCKIQHNFGC